VFQESLLFSATQKLTKMVVFCKILAFAEESILQRKAEELGAVNEEEKRTLYPTSARGGRREEKGERRKEKG
jgi:hypothetical protein